MKAYRLDAVDWYDEERDLLQCLVCRQWFKRIDTKHLRKHGIASTQDYKEEFGILSTTPLSNKAILQSSSENARRLREEGVFNVFKKGETSIPKNYQHNPKIRSFDRRNAEYKHWMSQALTGKPKSPEQVEKMRQVMLSDPDRRYRLKRSGYSFKPGQESWNKGKTLSDEVRRKISETRLKKISDGELVFGKVRVVLTCIVCGAQFYDYPHKQATRRTCGRACSGKIAGSKRKDWFANPENREKHRTKMAQMRQAEELVCLHCKQLFYVPPIQHKRGRKFCSRDCEVQAHYTINTCKQCGEPFKVRKCEMNRVKRCPTHRNPRPST